MRFIYTRAFALFSLILAVTAVLVFLQAKNLLNPLKGILLSVPRPVVYVVKKGAIPAKNFFSGIYQLRKIAQENARLAAKVAELQQSQAQFELEKRENAALRKELGLVKNTRQQPVACTVLSQNSFGLTDAVVLNCGSEKGVEEGQAVVSQGYLAGKIIYVGKSTSTALLATSSKFSADASLSRTGISAIVRGSFGAGLFLEQLPQNADIEKGWMVVTAGINEKIPKNIVIGEAGEVISHSNDLFKKATILSPIDFSNLEFVLVVK